MDPEEEGALCTRSTQYQILFLWRVLQRTSFGIHSIGQTFAYTYNCNKYLYQVEQSWHFIHLQKGVIFSHQSVPYVDVGTFSKTVQGTLVKHSDLMSQNKIHSLCLLRTAYSSRWYSYCEVQWALPMTSHQLVYPTKSVEEYFLIVSVLNIYECSFCLYPLYGSL